MSVTAYTDWIIRWRWLVVVFCVLSVVALGSGMRHLGLQQNYRVFFSDENPQLIAFDSLEAMFTQSDNHLFVIHNPEGSIFTEPALKAAHELTEAGWTIPYSTRVDSITNYQHSWAEGDDLIVEELLNFDEGPLTDSAIERAREVATTEPLLAGVVVSRDEDTMLVSVRLQLPVDDLAAVSVAATASKKLLSEVRQRYPRLRFELTGSAMLSYAFGEAPRLDAQAVFPAMFGLLTFFMFVFIRSPKAILATWAVTILSAAGGLGAAGYYGYGINPATFAAPVVILTLGIADSVHILLSMFKEMRNGMERNDALKESMRINAQPVFLTSLTTAIGFLVLNFSDSPPFNALGNITATGVGIAWLLSMTLLPAMLVILRVEAPRRRVHGERLMTALARFTTTHPGKIAFAMSALVLFLVASISTMRINDIPHKYFNEEIDFRTATDFMAEQLGFYQFSMSIMADDSGGVNNPEYLESLDRFASYLREQPGVVHVSTYSDIARKLNKNMHADDPAYYRVPQERELAAQYLLLYEMSLPYGLDLNDRINVDKSATRIDVLFQNVGMGDVRQAGLAAEAWLNENGVGARAGLATGPPVMFSYITENNVRAMVKGTLFGFGLISIVLIVSLRSVALGLMSLIPNLVPAATAFGIWALVVGEVGFAISVVAGLSIGIIVDDTVHFLSKYARGRRELGLTKEDAVYYAFDTVGEALFSTSVIVAGGFSVLMLSSFRVTVYMGALTALTVLCALIADFLLLPALLLILDRRTESTKSKTATAEAA